MRRIHVVLHQPMIPWNTGNVGCTCLGFGAQLHLIAPAFEVGDKAAKRAGLDYWPRVKPQVHACWPSFERAAAGARIDQTYLFSKLGRHGEVPLGDARFFGRVGSQGGASSRTVALVFGSEHTGLDGVSAEALDMLPCVYLPMSDHIRSYNLSSAVAMGLCEAHRQMEAQDALKLL